MKLTVSVQKRVCLMFCAFLLFFPFSSIGWTNGVITSHEETTSIVVPIVISLIGGIIAILGIFIAAKGGRASSNLEIKFGENKKLTLTRLTQGVVIVIIGAAILIAGLYNLPTTKKEKTVKAKTIEERDGKVIYKK